MRLKASKEKLREPREPKEAPAARGLQVPIIAVKLLVLEAAGSSLASGQHSGLTVDIELVSSEGRADHRV